MGDKIDKISSGVRPTIATQKVDSITKTAEVGKIEKAHATEEVANVKRSSRGTRVMSAKEKAYLMSLVENESEKIFSKTNLPEKERNKIQAAVKMTIEVTAITEEEDKA